MKRVPKQHGVTTLKQKTYSIGDSDQVMNIPPSNVGHRHPNYVLDAGHGTDNGVKLVHHQSAANYELGDGLSPK